MNHAIKCIFLITSLVSIVSLCEGEDRVFRNKSVAITFLPCPVLYELGAPIEIAFTVTKLTGAASSMNHFGAPDRLRFLVKDAEGLNVGEKARPDAIPLPPKNEDLLRWMPNESIAFSCDVSQVFDIKRPGAHKIIVTWDHAPIQEFDIEVIEMKPFSVHDVVSHGVSPKTYPKYFEFDIVPVQCRLEECSLKAKAASPITLFRIREYSVDGKAPIRIDLRHWEEREVTLEDAQLDYKWQLWTLLKSDREMALVLWNLREGRKYVVIPWGEHLIEMGSTWASQNTRSGRVVIAGIAGMTKVSTSTVSDSGSKH